MNERTKKQEETLREFLHSAVVPLIEDVLVKKLGQAMSYAKEQLDTPKQWVGLTDEDWHNLPTSNKQGCERDAEIFNWIEAKLKEKNNGL